MTCGSALLLGWRTKATALRAMNCCSLLFSPPLWPYLPQVSHAHLQVPAFRPSVLRASYMSLTQISPNTRSLSTLLVGTITHTWNFQLTLLEKNNFQQFPWLKTFFKQRHSSNQVTNNGTTKSSGNSHCFSVWLHWNLTSFQKRTLFVRLISGYFLM